MLYDDDNDDDDDEDDADDDNDVYSNRLQRDVANLFSVCT
jgi:hypothetical protein